LHRDESGQDQDYRQVIQGGKSDQLHHIGRCNLAARSLAEDANQHHGNSYREKCRENGACGTH